MKGLKAFFLPLSSAVLQSQHFYTMSEAMVMVMVMMYGGERIFFSRKFNTKQLHYTGLVQFWGLWVPWITFPGSGSADNKSELFSTTVCHGRNKGTCPWINWLGMEIKKGKDWEECAVNEVLPSSKLLFVQGGCIFSKANIWTCNTTTQMANTHLVKGIDLVYTVCILFWCHFMLLPHIICKNNGHHVWP